MKNLTVTALALIFLLAIQTNFVAAKTKWVANSVWPPQNHQTIALQDFAKRVGSGAAKSFSTAIIQAEQYGTSVSTAMRVIADELRDQRMALAEQKAASLPPLLTVPMILFFLPVLVAVILGPAGIQVADRF